MANWHLEDPRTALLKRDWKIAEGPGDDVRISGTWEMRRANDERARRLRRHFFNWVVLSSVGMCVSAGVAALSCNSTSTYEISGEKVLYYSHSDVATDTGLDPRTFRRLDKARGYSSCSESYVADAQKVQYDGKPVEGADVSTFVVFEEQGALYAKDRHHIYAAGKAISTAVKTFRIVDDYYATDGSVGFYLGKSLPGKRFVSMRFYAKSDAAVFYNGEILVGVDPNSFEVLSGNPTYGRDASTVLFEGLRLVDADSASFELLGTRSFHSRDRARVYYREQMISGADPKTIELVRGHYSHHVRDKRAIYAEGQEIVGADPATFKLSKFGTYATDNKHVYRFRDIVPNRDLASFEELEPPYSKDKNGVYHKDKLIALADPDTFIINSASGPRARDKNYFYDEDRPAGCVSEQAKAEGKYCRWIIKAN